MADRIDGPLPLPPLYGLLPAAEAPAAGVRIVSDLDAGGAERWLGGVKVFPYPIGDLEVWDACGHGGTERKGTGTDVPSPEYDPFTVIYSITCSAFGIWNQDEYKARAATAFESVESAGVAREFKTGAKMHLNPHLTDGEGTFPNGDVATTLVDGLALLEGEIASSGRFGLIHCSPMVATALRGHFVLDNKTGVLRTVNGNVVIPDAGYKDDEAPASHASPGAKQEWIFATGPVDIRRSEMFVMPDNVSQALDRGTNGASDAGANTITYRVERLYLVDWDTTLQAAVLVDRCLDACAGPS